LKPTRIYVKPVLKLLESVDIHGMAHITGGAFKKLTRLKDDVKFSLEHTPRQEIFKLIRKHARIDDKEMYSTFNMGIGFCIIVAKGDEDSVISTFNAHGINASIVGRVEDGKGVYINGIRLV
jgi:phosphoribosylformylglycinamidine cyclo-ligase